MLVRSWRGATRAVDAVEYLEYLRRTGLASYRATPGNAGAYALQRPIEGPDGGRAEFLILSFWESAEAVRAFAGDEVERAVFYPEDDLYLVERDDRVAHYELVFASDGRTSAEHGPPDPDSARP